MIEDTYTLLILGRPFLVASGCKIDMKRGRLTFEMGKCHVEFNFLEDQILSLASFVSDKVLFSHEIEMDYVWCCTHPSMFDWISSKGPNLDYAKVEFVTPMPPIITEDRPLTFNEGSLRVYHRFALLFTSLPAIKEIDFEFDLGIKFGRSLSDGLTSGLFCVQIMLFGAT